ncbi:MAG: peroxide stress protein YaaA [Prolixibacteraceae bacterium]|nr:peroxide stress protein YaaA [Prolixibacteraceae bacterium]
MLVILSPSKTLDFEPASPTSITSQPVFAKEAAELIRHLKKLSIGELEDMMRISTKLAWLNQKRFALWKPEFAAANSNQAIFSFKGEVYHGLDVPSMQDGDVENSQHHMRILSGLYGVLRPLDLIQPYRLEMGTSFRFGKYADLYHFWRQKITRQIGIDLKESGSYLLINLASQEYFSAIENKKLNAKIVTPQFLENTNDSFKMITVYAKKARGMMARYILEYHINCEEDLRGFDGDGYYYNSNLSKPGSPVFTR